MSLADLLTWLPAGGVGSMLLGTLLLAVFLRSLFSLVAQIRKRLQGDNALKNFPGPLMHWLWGNLRDVRTIEEMLPLGRKRTLEYGPIRRLRVGPFLNQIILAGPEYLKTLLSTGEPKEPFLYGFIKPWIGDGLLLSKGKKWARNRRLLTPAFHFDVLKPYCDVFSDCTMIMVNKWKKMLEKSNRIEMFQSVSLMTLDSLLKCAFTYPSNCQTDSKNPYIQAVYLLSELAFKRLRNLLHHNPILYYFSWNGYRFRNACKLVQNYSQEVIQARRKEPRNEAQSRKYLDFLDILLDARDEAGNGLTDEEIQHEVDTFMFEGHDTTASGLSWFFYNMAKHPEEQQKCRDEIMSVIGEQNQVTWDDLGNFDYLTMCIKESLRTHPPVTTIARRLTKPLHFPGDLTAPEGMWVNAGIYTLHHNPQVWPDPEKFDPLRFTPENTKDRSPHAYTPFSAGPRNCIGQHFAMNEMKICAALTLKHFELSFTEDQEPIEYPELILRSKEGIWLTVKEIKH